MPDLPELNVKDIPAQTAHGKVTGTLPAGGMASWDTTPWTLGRLAGVVALTGTAETLLEEHEGCLLTLDNGSAITFTVPQDSTLGDVPVGARVGLMRLGAGQVTVQAGSGATVRCGASFDNFRAQYCVAWLIKIAANTWVFTGDTAAT